MLYSLSHKNLTKKFTVQKRILLGFTSSHLLKKPDQQNEIILIQFCMNIDYLLLIVSFQFQFISDPTKLYL